ncbi:MAG: FIST C-terminal domain-containing protein, partial [Leptospiraceae bacterium]|nr:FIST C-terminal domain-containing protein [Leptospiraceae bacterium]
GDIPVGTKVRFMKTEVDNLIRASSKTANESHLKETTDLVFVVSCAGRRFVMNRLTEEELEAIDGAVGAGAIISGFYSFAELAPSSRVNPCDLHNQTITLTMFRETGPRFDK